MFCCAARSAAQQNTQQYLGTGAQYSVRMGPGAGRICERAVIHRIPVATNHLVLFRESVEAGEHGISRDDLIARLGLLTRGS